jgi:hypothetical protein
MAETPPELRSVLERASRDMPELGGLPAQPAEPVLVVNGEAPNSLIAGLRAQHTKIGRETTTTIALPWWQDKLGVRFHYLDDRGFDKLLAVASGSSDSTAIRKANVDIVIAGCDEVVARASADDDWGSLVPGERLRFDHRLAELLALDAGDSAKSVLVALWDTPVKAAMAIGEVAGQYSTWLRGQAPEVAERLTGESPRPGS